MDKEQIKATKEAIKQRVHDAFFDGLKEAKGITIWNGIEALFEEAIQVTKATSMNEGRDFIDAEEAVRDIVRQLAAQVDAYKGVKGAQVTLHDAASTLPDGRRVYVLLKHGDCYPPKITVTAVNGEGHRLGEIVWADNELPLCWIDPDNLYEKLGITDEVWKTLEKTAKNVAWAWYKEGQK